jgi:predicted enzyme related to lactoylglutathione lyase
MSIDNVLASVAVKNVGQASEWYAALLGHAAQRPMPEVAEWTFPRGGCLQVYQLPERAGQGSFTVAVSDIDEQEKLLGTIGVQVLQRSSNSRVKTLMIVDPDGNHIAFAEAIDPTLAR